MSRPQWTGDLVIGALRVPVRLHTAGEPPIKVTFNQAHKCKATKLTRIEMKRWCPDCEKEIPYDDLRRVYEHAPGQLVEITNEQVAKCDAPASHDLQAIAVVDEMDGRFIASTAVIYPGGDSPEIFDTVSAALRDRYIVAVLTIYKRRSIVMLQASPTGFVMYQLRTHEHVQKLAAGAPATRRMAIHTEVSKAAKILDSLSKRFDYDELVDEHGLKLQKLVTTKVKGHMREQLATAADQAGQKRKRA